MVVISRTPRKDIAVPVRLVFTGGAILLGDSVNISNTGMLVLAEEARPVGTHFRFQCPDFKGMGEIVWTRDSEPGVQFLKLLGIKFLPLEPSDRKALDELLDDSVG